MEFVGCPLETALAELKRRGARCTVRYTASARDFFPVTDAFYVVWQSAAAEGVELVAAAKMGKEV